MARAARILSSMPDVVVALIAGVFGLVVGVLGARQTRHLDLAERRLERHGLLLKEARTFYRLTEDFARATPAFDDLEPLRSRVQRTSFREATERVQDSSEQTQLAASPEVRVAAMGVSLQAFLMYSELDAWARGITGVDEAGGITGRPREYPERLFTRHRYLDEAIGDFIRASSEDLGPWTSLRVVWLKLRRLLHLP